MITGGVPRDVAAEFAAAETKARRKAAGIVTEAIAQGASLIAITERGQTRFFVTGKVDDLPPEARTRLQKAAASGKNWVPAYYK